MKNQNSNDDFVMRKRLSTLLTFFCAWIIPVLTLGLFTPLSILLFFVDVGIGIKIYLICATAFSWIIYLKLKPWNYKYIYQDDNGFLFKEKGQEKLIIYKDIIRIYSLLWTKYSPIVIEYSEYESIIKVIFIPRQSNVLLLLPFFHHPMVEELKTNLNIKK